MSDSMWAHPDKIAFFFFESWPQLSLSPSIKPKAVTICNLEYSIKAHPVFFIVFLKDKPIREAFKNVLAEFVR